MKQRYVPLSKRSKKAQEEAHREKRALWPIPPVTKRIESKKLYNRKKRASEGPQPGRMRVSVRAVPASISDQVGEGARSFASLHGTFVQGLVQRRNRPHSPQTISEMGTGTARARDHGIDCFKTLLVLGMLAAHTIQLAMHTENQAPLAFSRYINLVTFSGFLFSFGYVNQLAYFPKSWAGACKRLLRNFLLTLLAYYASGISLWLINALASGGQLYPSSLLYILLFFRVPGYSEFLLSFAMLNLLVCCFFPLIKRVLSDDRLLWIAMALCAFSTCLDYSRVKNNLLGVFIGTTEFNAFPLLQYFPYYLAGARLAMPKKERFLLPVSICLTIAFFAHMVWRGLPARFPPSFLWVGGGSLFIALYYLFSQAVAGPGQTLPALILRLISFVGGNTLYYLLFSNILLFAYMAMGVPLESGWWGFMAYLLLLLLTTLLVWGRKAAMDWIKRCCTKTGRQA